MGESKIQKIAAMLFLSSSPQGPPEQPPPVPDKMTAEDYMRYREDLKIDVDYRVQDAYLWFSEQMEELAQRAESDGLVDSCGRFPHHKDYGKDRWDTLIDTVRDVSEVYHGSEDFEDG